MRDWTRLCRVANEIEAQLVAGYLEVHDIAVDIQSTAYHPYPENLGMLGAVIVRVPAEELARAEELLARLPQAEIDGVPELAPDGTGEDAGGGSGDDSSGDEGS